MRITAELSLYPLSDDPIPTILEFVAGLDDNGHLEMTVNQMSTQIRGELEVELWGGWADPERTRPWQRDTLVNVYSCTKGVTATCMHRLVEAGALALDAPVADYWPEFAAAGKARVSVRELLSHRAGLAGIREKIPYDARFDAKRQAAALAAQEPWWEPGTKHGYHAVTFGTLSWILNDSCRQLPSGRDRGQLSSIPPAERSRAQQPGIASPSGRGLIT